MTIPSHVIEMLNSQNASYRPIQTPHLIQEQRLGQFAPR